MARGDFLRSLIFSVVILLIIFFYLNLLGFTGRAVEETKDVLDPVPDEGLCDTYEVPLIWKDVFNEDYDSALGKIFWKEDCAEVLYFQKSGEGVFYVIYVGSEIKKDGRPVSLKGLSGRYLRSKIRVIAGDYVEVLPEKAKEADLLKDLESAKDFFFNNLVKNRDQLSGWEVLDVSGARSLFSSVYNAAVLEGWTFSNGEYVSKKSDLKPILDERKVLAKYILEKVDSSKKHMYYRDYTLEYEKVETVAFSKKIKDFVFEGSSPVLGFYIKDYVKGIDYKNFDIKPLNSNNLKGEFVAWEVKPDGSVWFTPKKNFYGTAKFRAFFTDPNTKNKIYSNSFSVTFKKGASGAPILVYKFKDISLKEGSSIKIDLSRHFKNPLNGSLNYSKEGGGGVDVLFKGDVAILSLNRVFRTPEKMRFVASNKAGKTAGNLFYVALISESSGGGDGASDSGNSIGSRFDGGIVPPKKNNNGIQEKGFIESSSKNSKLIVLIIVLLVLIIVILLVLVYLMYKKKFLEAKAAEEKNSVKRINEYLNNLREDL